MVRRDQASQGVSMTPSTLTPADFDQLVQELDSLRAAHRDELERQLRDARSFGSPGDDDDWLTVMKDTAIDRGRIARLERLVASATVADEPASSHAGAGLGMRVRVRDDAGRTLDYELVGRRSSHDPPTRVSLGSPVGRALIGSQPGDVVHVELPNGRRRPLSVIDVCVDERGQ
jgi:transcription elongation factor GreA